MRIKNTRPLKPENLSDVYRTLLARFGRQNWWPAKTPFEVMVGAILTQNTSWRNVEKAIANLRDKKKLTPQAIQKLSLDRLAQMIRPAGYFNIKARRLKNFVSFYLDEFKGNITRMRSVKGSELRIKLLAVNGIGQETADAILLYACRKPFFVIDAYTKRIFLRHGLNPSSKKCHEKNDYGEWQNLFSSYLPQSEALFNDYHAQIVETAKRFCLKSRPMCGGCPLEGYL